MMNRRETADAAPHPPIRSGLAAYGIEPTWAYVDMSTIPRTQARPIPGSNPGLPWLRQSELVVQPGQQQMSGDCPDCGGELEVCIELDSHAWVTCRGCGAEMRPQWRTCTDCGEQLPPLIQGSAEECSAERPRAPETQPVAPAEGRAWETPATRAV